MMLILKYGQSGGFSDFALPVDLAFLQAEGIDTWRLRVGYGRQTWAESLPDAVLPSAACYQKATFDADLDFVAILSLGNDVYLIFADDVPAMFDLHLRLTKYVANAVSIEQQKVIAKGVRKLFRLVHPEPKHDVLVDCALCDPIAAADEEREIRNTGRTSSA